MHISIFFLRIRRPPISTRTDTLFPYTTLFRSVPFAGLERDNNLRPDITLEKLASLGPAFDRKSGHGTLTAGNSTPLTDGASAVLLASEDWAKAHGFKPLAYITHAETAAVDFAGSKQDRKSTRLNSSH